MLIKKMPVRLANSEYRDRKYISHEEFKILYNGRVAGKRESEKRILRHKAILSLLYYHGLRRGELTDLKWSAFDWSAETLHVHRSKSGKDSIHPLVKGEKALLQKLEALKRYEYVLDSPSGKATASCINGFFAYLNRRKLIPLKVTPHMLRHGCGFFLANKGVDTRTIQVYLGHASITSTEIYTEINPNRFKSLFD